jgi:acetoin utilization protein AcuB
VLHVQGKYDAASLTVSDVMTPDPITVSGDEPLSTVVSHMERRGIQHFPVIEGSKVVAMLNERNLRDAMPSVLTVSDVEERRRFLRVSQVKLVAEPDPPSIAPGEPLAAAICKMRDRRAGALAVVDRGKLVGILSAGDLISLLERLLRDAKPPRAVP